jgi:hypothetical protein
MNQTQLQGIVGTRILSAWHNKESDSWLVLFTNGDSLNIECMWRLLEDGCIKSTSNDHDQLFGRDIPINGEATLNKLAEHEILSAQCTAQTGDLDIKLGQHFNLQVIADSAGYESWQYKKNSGGSFVAVGGHVHGY